MLLQRFGEHFKFNFSLIWNSHQLSNMKFWPLHHEHHTHHTRVRISEKFFRGRITVNAGCDALVLALIDVVTGPTVGMTRGGRCCYSIQVFHHAFKILHLIIKLLCAVTVRRLQSLCETIARTVLRVQDVRRPHLGHCRQRGEVHPSGVNGGWRAGIVAWSAWEKIAFEWTRWLRPNKNCLWLGHPRRMIIKAFQVGWPPWTSAPRTRWPRSASSRSGAWHWAGVTRRSWHRWR